jgi:hypothetical protein
MVVVFYLQNWNKGINERSELPPLAEVKVKTKVHTEVLGGRLRTQIIFIFPEPLYTQHSASRWQFYLPSVLNPDQ